MSGRTWIGATLALALLAPGAANAAEPPAPPPGYVQEMRPVAEGVWVLTQPAFLVQPAGNVTVIEQADGFVLVDAGGSPGAARRVVEQVRKLGSKPVKAVIVTHWHGDHPQGLAEILAAWPRARTIATEATRAHLSNPDTMNTPAVLDAERDRAFYEKGAQLAAYSRDMAGRAETESERDGWAQAAGLFERYREDMLGATTLAPVEGFTGRLVIEDREAPVEALFLGRANTDGDAVVWLPVQRVLVTGDLVVAPIPFGFGSYPADWIETLKRLRGYDFAALVPGHGAPQADRAYLDRLIALLSEVRAQVGPLAAQGLNLEETRKRVDFAAQAAAFAGDDPWLRRWFDQYWVQPITAAAWKEAKGLPIEQSLKGE